MFIRHVYFALSKALNNFVCTHAVIIIIKGNHGNPTWREKRPVFRLIRNVAKCDR